MRHYFQSKPYREFIKTQTCTFNVCGHKDCEGPMDPQHDPALGEGSNDLHCIPLCRKHHNLHKDRPDFYRSVITEQVLRSTKEQMLQAFFRYLELDTEKPVIKPGKRKKEDAPKTSRFAKPIDQSNRGKGSATRPLNVPRYT
jgi:hypothetical protein